VTTYSRSASWARRWIGYSLELLELLGRCERVEATGVQVRAGELCSGRWRPSHSSSRRRWQRTPSLRSRFVPVCIVTTRLVLPITSSSFEPFA